MPLTPKDEIDESQVEQNTKESDSESLEELRERVADLEERTEVPLGLDTLDNLHEAHQDRHGWIEDRVEELESRVDRQEAVLYDLINAVEVLGSAADWNEIEGAFERVADHGSDAYPWQWEGETLDFKVERYE